MKKWMRSGSCALVVLLAFGASAQEADGHGDPSGTAVDAVISTALTETDGKHASVVVVTVEPGAHFDPHRHPGTVLVYVLEGVIESALDDEEPTSFKAGDAWTEPVGALHRVTQNNSGTTAKLLAVLVHDKDAALQLPAE